MDNVIEGGLLSTECAVTKLMWALGKSNDRKNIIEMINQPIALDKSRFEEI